MRRTLILLILVGALMIPGAVSAQEADPMAPANFTVPCCDGWNPTDDRIAGDWEETDNDYSYEVRDDEEVYLGWGTLSITNDDGAWLGSHRYIGRPAGDGYILTSYLNGSDAYNGLSAMIQHDIRDEDSGAESTIYGVIYPTGTVPNEFLPPASPGAD